MSSDVTNCVWDSVSSTAAILPSVSIFPTGTTSNNTTITYPSQTVYPYNAPYQYQTTSVFPTVGSTSHVWSNEPEWTHRIWYNEHWHYYMQTSNEKEDILMNRRKITQGCTLT